MNFISMLNTTSPQCCGRLNTFWYHTFFHALLDLRICLDRVLCIKKLWQEDLTSFASDLLCFCSRLVTSEQLRTHACLTKKSYQHVLFMLVCNAPTASVDSHFVCIYTWLITFELSNSVQVESPAAASVLNILNQVGATAINSASVEAQISRGTVLSRVVASVCALVVCKQQTETKRTQCTQ